MLQLALDHGYKYSADFRYVALAPALHLEGFRRSSMTPSDSVQVTLGGLQVSVLIATFVYAISCFQVFLYWRSRLNDRLGLRILVWIVW